MQLPCIAVCVYVCVYMYNIYSICIYTEFVDSPRPEHQKDFSTCGCTFQRLPSENHCGSNMSLSVFRKSSQWD